MARAHAEHPGLENLQCNMHSWGANEPAWESCCYFEDHADPDCMLAKPRLITAKRYTAHAVEISAAGYGSYEAAIAGWFRSPGHSPYLLAPRAAALGCSSLGGLFHCWLGMQVHPSALLPLI